MVQIEFDMFIPADVTVGTDGVIADYTHVYQFDNRDTFFLKSFTGDGMPGIEYITQRGPFQHGETLLDYRLQPRVIQLVHRRLGNCRLEYWENRSDILNQLRPNRQLLNTFNPGRLRKIFPNGDIRDIYAIIQDGPRFEPRSDNWDEFAFEESLRFIAHDPTYFDPVQLLVEWTLDAINQLVFPCTFPIVFGSGIINEIVDINYPGTWLSFPTFVIQGPINSPTIRNNTTQEEIVFSYNVAAGEIITINLSYGNKTVTNNFGTNLIGTVSSNSDLATFHIAPDPEAANGVNEFLVTGSNGVAGQTTIRMTYYVRYIGI